MSQIIHVIDDDADILYSLEHLIRKKGYTVIADLTGKAIDIDHLDLADLYLIDADLGSKINGIDLCELIKNKDQKVPVILMSAHPRLAGFAMGCNADTFISKPFDIDLLMFAIDKALQK